MSHDDLDRHPTSKMDPSSSLGEADELGPFELLLTALDASLTSGSAALVPDLTSIPEELAAKVRGAHNCLVLLHSAVQSGQLDDLVEKRTSRPSSVSTAESIKKIGRFSIVRELGRGGYGVVFLAYDPRLNREVALKVPRPEAIVTPDLERRFLHEAEAAGSLQHANLVTVLEVGQDGPLCYIASSFCHGPTLAAWQAARRMAVPCDDAAAAIAALADGVDYAHRHGVLHRDIKPSNILLEPLDGDAPDKAIATTSLTAYTPKLTDFGLAKLLERADSETRSGALLGTPAYMSPEQATGRLSDVCAATDVYGLGVVLYELLAGHPPFRGTTDPDTLRQVCLDEPASVNRVRLEIPGDLAAIVLKCLEKNPSARYRSAAELKNDLRRYLAGEPTLARPLRWHQWTLRWVRRRPLVAGLLSVIAAGAICLIATVAMYTSRLSTALTESEQRRIEAVAQQNEANHQRETAEASQRRSVVSQTETRHMQYAADVQLADEAYRAGNPRQAVAHLSRHIPSTDDPKAIDQRDFGWHYLWQRCHNCLLTLRGHAGPVFCTEYSPDGQWIGTAGRDGTIRQWDATTGQPIRALEGHDGDVNAIGISPDSMLMSSAGADGTVRIWNAETGRQLRTLLEGASEMFTVRFSASGRLLAAGGTDGVVRIWRTENWTQVGTLEGHANGVESLDFSPDEKMLASAGADSLVVLWDLDQRTPRAKLEGHCRAVYTVRFSPSGGQIAAGGQSGELIFWDAKTGAELRRIQAHTTRLTGLAFSPDGSRLLTASRDASARLWDVSTAKMEAIFDGHAERLWQVAFSPQGTSFATASWDGTAKLCKLSEPYEVLPQFYIERGQVVIDDGGTLHAVSRGGLDSRVLSVYDGNTRHDWLPPGDSKVRIFNTSLDSTGCVSAAFNTGGQLWLRTRNHPWELVSGTHSDSANDFCPPILSPDGSFLAIGIDKLQIIDTHHGQPIFELPLAAKPTAVQFSHDGRQIAATLFDGRAIVWNMDDHGPTPRVLLCSTLGWFSHICFSPDDQLLALASDQGRVFVVNALDGSVQHELPAHIGAATGLAFSRDGRNLATAGRDCVVRLWDLRTGQNLLVLDQLPQAANSLAFGPHDDELICYLREGAVIRWTAPHAGEGFRRTVVARGDHCTSSAEPTSVLSLPWGEPRRAESLLSAFQQFASKTIGPRVVQPTFDDREDDQGLRLGALELSGRQIGADYDGATSKVDFIDLAREADSYARRVLGTAGSPFLYGGKLPGLIHLLEPGTFERRDLPVGELGEIDSDRDRFREIHRWAKAHGFAGGFPNFVDVDNDGATSYGAVLIKAGHAREIFLPASSVWTAVVENARRAPSFRKWSARKATP